MSETDHVNAMKFMNAVAGKSFKVRCPTLSEVGLMKRLECEEAYNKYTGDFGMHLSPAKSKEIRRLFEDWVENDFEVECLSYRDFIEAARHPRSLLKLELVLRMLSDVMNSMHHDEYRLT